MQWIYHQGINDFDDMHNFSKDLRDKLGSIASLELPEVVSMNNSKDGVVKWVIKLGKDNHIETVYIPQKDRGTLCISSQVGCSLACTFCSTGYQGFNRNLKAHEIIGQVLVAKNHLVQENKRISNVVFMGMGEPLLNYDAVVPALRLMLDDRSFGLSRRRVTLSTAGVVPAIDRLRSDCPVSLAVSLHAPDDELRTRLVPLNKKYPIAMLMDACRRYIDDDSRRRITFEYTMLDGVNDSRDQAVKLARLLGDMPAKVNLIPVSYTHLTLPTNREV